MANYILFIPIALLVALCLSLLNIQKLNTELQTLENDNKLLIQDLNKIRDKNFAMEERLKNIATQTGEAELRWRDCMKNSGKQRTVLTDTLSQLQTKTEAYEVLNKQFKEVKEAQVAKEREMTKIIKEMNRYHDLYEAGNAQLNEVRNAYENLKKLVEEEAARAARLKAEGVRGGPSGNVAGPVLKRDTMGEAAAANQNSAVPKQNETGTTREKPKQDDSTADKMKSSGKLQEQNVDKVEETPQQQAEEKEETEVQETEEDAKERGENRDGEGDDEAHAEEENKAEQRNLVTEVEIRRTQEMDGDE